MIDKVIHDNCTGCNMCGDICPQSAISYISDQEGFWQPKVDYNKCVKCGLCTKKCPVLTTESFKKNIPSVFAAWSLDSNVRYNSTSGGIYYELAKKIIDNGGAIAGVVYDDDWKGAHFEIGYTIDDLNKIMGSKYFQADAIGIYSKVRSLLLEGKTLLFCGTPCQCAALQSYLGNEYENLYIVDFICRGINSPLAYKRHIEELEEENNSKASFVHLKDKHTGWQSLATYVEFENGKHVHQDKDHSWWVKGFVAGNGLFCRRSCYHCKFRTIPRNTDITIGDFWGIKYQKPEDMFNGISGIMVNSDKGTALINQIKDRIHIEEHNFDELDIGNPAIRISPKWTKERANFFELLKDHKFSEAVQLSDKTKKKSEAYKVASKCYHFAKKIKHGLGLLRKIRVFTFIKYNYFSKNVVRQGKAKIIPYKNAIIDLDKESRIYLKGRNLEIGINKLKGSKAETHLRMNGNAKWYCNDGCSLFYDTVLEIKPDAVLETGYFSMNGGSVIICDKHITFGNDVMLGRNIIVYDSDFHQIWNGEYKISNKPKDVVIEDHVWLTSNIIVLKGVTIGRDSIIAAYTSVAKDIPPHSTVAGKAVGEVIAQCNNWSRRMIRSGLPEDPS